MDEHGIKNVIESNNINQLVSTINNLLEKNKDFYLNLYNYIISINIQEEIKKENNDKIVLYFIIVKAYLSYMNDKSFVKGKKDKLIEVFVDYINYGIYILNHLKGIDNEIFSQEEKSLIFYIDKATEFLEINNLERAIEYLEIASFKVEYLTLPVRYYIQKIISENNAYYYKLSICIIAKNEEKHIERCLKSIKPLVDKGIAEIILVDTGSMDNTINLARNYTDKVYFHQWKNDFSEARNYSIAMAKGEYLLIIDADEELEKSGVKELIKIFSTEEYKRYRIYTFREKNFVDISLKTYSIFTRAFIFKNEEYFCYLKKIHEQPITVYYNRDKNNMMNLNVSILHYGYIMDDKIKKLKFDRNIELIKNELKDNPDNFYYLFQMITEYASYGKFDEALKVIDKLMHKLTKEPFNKKYLVYYNKIVSVYMEKAIFDKALKLCDLALEKQNDFIDFIFAKAKILFLKENYKEASKYIDMYLNLLEEFYEHSIASDITFIFYSLSSQEEAISIALVSCCANKEYEKLYIYIDFIIKNIDIISEGIKQLVVSAILNMMQEDKKIDFSKFQQKNIDCIFKQVLEILKDNDRLLSSVNLFYRKYYLNT